MRVRSLRYLLGFVGGCVTAAPGIAQLPLRAPADTGSWWHTAEELRPLVDREGGPPSRSLALARAELGLGRAERAVEILRHTRIADSLSPTARAVLGTATFLTGDFATAGQELAEAAAGFRLEERGVLLARAAEALRRAGADSAAAVLYERARAALPWIDGWLAIQQALVTGDPADALRLLRRAPPEAARAAARVRAVVLLKAADSTRALAALVQAGQWAAALDVATAIGDTVEARHVTYEALLDADSTTVRTAVTAARQRFPPQTQQEWFVLASALRRTRRTREAIALLKAAAARGDSSSALLRRVADLESSVGARSGALATYARAAQLGGPDAALAAYRRARLLTRIGRAAAGHAAMAAFAREHSGHENAPIALYLVGSWYADRGLGGTADSIFEDVTRRWPEDGYASRARIRLAQAALTAGDTAGASEWYRAEALSGAAEANAARYFLGVLSNRSGDSTAADQIWRELAEADSVGYYGTLARNALALGPVEFAAGPGIPESQEALLTLRRIDLLYASFLTEAAEVVIDRQLQRREFEEDELLALAAGLIDRGWVQQGVSLGWRATRLRTLNDPFVIRLVFPFPLREMVCREAREHDLDPYLLAGLVRQESNFRPTVVSRAGAIGLMQLMPATGRELLRKEGAQWDVRLLSSAEVNLHLGARHLATLLERYDGRVVPALAAYNAGSRPVDRWLRYPEASDSVQFVERIPYVETRGYVRSILRNRSLYLALYPDLVELADHGNVP